MLGSISEDRFKFLCLSSAADAAQILMKVSDASCRYIGSQSNCCLFKQYFDPLLALISVENDIVKVITFVIPSITF